MIATAVISGYLGGDPRVTVSKHEKKVANFSVGVSVGKDKTDWYQVECWNPKLVEFAENHLKKGSAVIVNGRLKQENYTTQHGEIRHDVSITADSVEFAPARSQQQAPPPAPAPAAQQGYAAPQYVPPQAHPPAPPQYPPDPTQQGGYWPGPGAQHQHYPPQQTSMVNPHAYPTGG